MAQKLVASFGTFSERKCTMALVLSDNITQMIPPVALK